MLKKYTLNLLAAIGIVFALCFIFFSKQLLNGLSQALIHEDNLVPTPAIVVLSGSYTGNRIKTAAKLFHDGFGEKLIFSGFKIYPGTATNELMKKYALKLGVPDSKIVTEISDEESSTRGESIANLKLLKKINARSFILVTSPYHTKRSKLIYQRSINASGGGGVEFSVYPAPDPAVPVKGWWKLRTGQISIFLEYLKFVSFYFDF